MKFPSQLWMPRRLQVFAEIVDNTKEMAAAAAVVSEADGLVRSY